MMSRNRKALLAAVALTPLLFLSAFGVQSATSGFSAKISTSGNSVGSATQFVTATSSGGNTECTSIPSGSTVSATANFPCSNSLYPSGISSAASSTTTNLAATGSGAFTGATLKASACTVKSFSNSVAAANPMLARGNVGWGQAGPSSLAGSAALGFDGSTTSGTSVVAITNPLSYSVGIWFKTNVATGALLGFSQTTNGATGSSELRDRVLYLTSNGYPTFTTYQSSAFQTATGTTSVADGNWHYALASVTAASTSVINLYVDGALVGTKSIAATSASTAYNGYWHAGYTNITSQSAGAVTGDYFNGSLSNFTYFPSALSASNVAALYANTSQSGFAANATSLGVSNLWTMNESGSTTYAGATGGSPCAHVSVSVQADSVCAYPSNAAGCPALSTSYTLAGLVSAGNVNLAAAPLSGNQNLTLTVGSNSNYSAAFDSGLHLVLPATLTQKGFTTNLIWSTGEMQLS